MDGRSKRLVLGFDAGCAACGELARRIEERAGDRIEVRSLRHPQVEHWRARVLGEDAPWAPTLFEVGGARGVRAWTGPRLAVKLARVLGPVSAWRIVQALGEIGAPETAAHTTAAGISRGQFLKGVGGTVLAFGVLSGTASPVRAADEFPYDQLVEVFSAIEEIPDPVLDRGDEAASRWLQRRLEEDGSVFQTQGFWGCVKAIGVALASNAIPVAKILKIKKAIRAVGGVRNFVSILQAAYNYARRRGYSRLGAIKFAAHRAAEVSGVDVVNALLGLFSLDGVVRACF